MLSWQIQWVATHALYMVADPKIAPRISRWTLVSPWMSQTWIPSVVNQTIVPQMINTGSDSTLSMTGSMSSLTSSEGRQFPSSRKIDIMHCIVAYY